MVTYAFRAPGGDIVSMHPEFCKPKPVHAQAGGSVEAVEAIRRMGQARRALLAEAKPVAVAVAEPYAISPGFEVAWRTGEIVSVVTGAPKPIDPVTAGARRLLALAEAKGFTAQILTTDDACTVEGHHPSRVGFRAIWKRGATHSASWHEPWRYEEITDERPQAGDSRTKTGKAGHRAPGVGTRRLSITGTPWGIRVNITELTTRLRALDGA